jgi:hypothetical protein
VLEHKFSDPNLVAQKRPAKKRSFFFNRSTYVSSADQTQDRIETLYMPGDEETRPNRALTPSQMIVEEVRNTWDRGEGPPGRGRVSSVHGLLNFVSGAGRSSSTSKLSEKRSAPALLSMANAQGQSAPVKDEGTKGNQVFRLGVLAMRSTETLMMSTGWQRGDEPRERSGEGSRPTVRTVAHR